MLYVPNATRIVTYFNSYIIEPYPGKKKYFSEFLEKKNSDLWQILGQQ